MDETRPIRLLNILTVRFGANGVTVFVMNYSRHIDPARVTMDFVVPNVVPDRIMQEIAARGGRVFVLPQRNRNPVSYVQELTQIVRENRYDIVHAHGNSATLYVDMLGAKRGGAKRRIAHSHNSSCKMKFADALLRPLFYKSYTDAMACGAQAGEWLFPNRPFTVVQNAIDTETFSFHAADRAVIREQLGLSPDAFLLCHIGTFNEQKNHAFLLNVFNEIHKRADNAHLLLVGDGPLRDATELAAYKLRLTDRVHSIGAVPLTAAYLAAADAFVLPSLHEGLPFTLIEAQASGLSCFVSGAVTRDAFFTDSVTAIPLSAETALWADTILAARDKSRNDAARLAASAAAVERIRQAGYDILDNAEKLTMLYADILAGARA